MNLTELKNTPVSELITLGENMGLENQARMRKQDIIFAILKQHAKSGEDIFGDGVLEILQDGFGFLRSADSSYLAGPDDIYVSPSQIRRFNLRTGDTISGKIRPPKEGERYFALLKVNEVNYDKPENARNKILFENLTPLHANSRLRMERGNGSTEDLTARVLDLASPIGRGQRQLIIGDRQTGKTALAIDAVLNQKSNWESGDPNKQVRCIYVAIGQKGSTIASVRSTLERHGAMEYTTIVASPASDPAGYKYLAPYTGSAIGQHWMYNGKHVLIVEDIVDTGLTLSYLVQNLQSRGPDSVEVLTMFRKPDAMTAAVAVKHVGFDIPNEFVVGYGLDYAGRYRNLTDVGTLAPHVYS